jgi:hypothetical protein
VDGKSSSISGRSANSIPDLPYLTQSKKKKKKRRKKVSCVLFLSQRRGRGRMHHLLIDIPATSYTIVFFSHPPAVISPKYLDIFFDIFAKLKLYQGLSKDNGSMEVG